MNKLAAGLGNPGRNHKRNRHNVGFMALDHFAAGHGIGGFRENAKFHSEIAEGDGVIFAKPQTYMNDSGRAIRKLSDYYDIPAEQILLVYDELALPFGTIRAREGGTSAGHNGVESVINNLDGGFHRLRIGIANEHSGQTDASKFVLSDFSQDERSQLLAIFDVTNRYIGEFIDTGGLQANTAKVV